MVMEQYLEVARFTKTHGLRGDIKAQFFTDSIEDFGNFPQVYLGTEKTPLTIENARGVGGAVLLKIKGIDTIDDAKKLTGKFLYADRSDFNLPENSWFIRDLLGLKVIDADSGAEYGVVEDILQNGPTDVYSVKTPTGLFMFPSLPEVIIETDITNGYIKIRPPEGLLEVYE
jgi:16S rRNA processing protein RimM